MKDFRCSFVPLAFLLAVSVGSQVAPPAKGGPQGHLPARGDRRHETSPVSERTTNLLNEGRRAEKRGDLDAAEGSYREVVAFRPGVEIFRFDLARVLDGQGREVEAYREYRLAMVRSTHYWSSEQDDPRVLARYGDLALRFGTPDEAAQAYAFGATQSGRDDYWDPVTTPRDASSLASLRAAAHTASAIRLRGIGKKAEAIVALQTAIAADGRYWVAHFYLARWSKSKYPDEAKREAALAESLAPAGKYREMVRRERARYHL